MKVNKMNWKVKVCLWSVVILPKLLFLIWIFYLSMSRVLIFNGFNEVSTPSGVILGAMMILHIKMLLHLLHLLTYLRKFRKTLNFTTFDSTSLLFSSLLIRIVGSCEWKAGWTSQCKPSFRQNNDLGTFMLNIRPVDPTT